MHEYLQYVPKELPLWCPDRDVTREQIRLTIVNEMRKRPETLHLPFAGHVLAALATKFPCAPRAARPTDTSFGVLGSPEIAGSYLAAAPSPTTTNGAQ